MATFYLGKVKLKNMNYINFEAAKICYILFDLKIYMKLTILFFIVIHSCITDIYCQCPELEVLNLKKTALILGERGYSYANPLVNTTNDATDIADSLRKIGFDVNVYTDSDLKTMNAAVDQWCSKLSSYNVALFYFSGHGAEFNTENYLFPIDANPKTPMEMSFQCLSANALLSRIDNSNVRFNIIILDACRTNPFAKSWSRNILMGGLAAMTGKGTFIGYAAAPGKTASDGTGRNGVYTEAILKFITIPGLTIDQIFTKVNLYVRNASKEDQIPFKNSSLSSDYCFSVKRSNQKFIRAKHVFNQLPSDVLLSDDQSFLINTTDSGILIKDALTLNNLQTINTSLKKPLQMVLKNEETVILVDSNSKKICIVDIKTKKITGNLNLEHSPTCITVSNIENKVYVSFANGKTGGVYEIDLTWPKITKVINLEFVPSSIILSSDGKTLFVLSPELLAMMDMRNNKISKQVNLLDGGKCLGLSPDNKLLVVGAQKANQGRTLFFDASSLKLKKALELETNMFSFTFDSLKVLAVNLKELFVIDLKNLLIINRIPFNSELKGIAISEDGVANIWLPSENRFHVYKMDQLLNTSEIDPEVKLKEFKEVSKNYYLSEMEDNYLTKLFFDTLNIVYESAVNEIRNELGPAYSVTKKGRVIVMIAGDSIGFNNGNKTFGDRFGIFAYNNRKQINTHYVGRLSLDDFILRIYEEPKTGNPPETYRTSKHGVDWVGVKAFVRKYFLLRLDQLKE